jgi:DNA-binding MarR family transcriptional regulator
MPTDRIDPIEARPNPENSTPQTCNSEPEFSKAYFKLSRALIFLGQPPQELDMLPLAQLRLLWSVYGFPNGTMKDFSERLMVSQSTLTNLADKLVKRGLIERHADEADRRMVRLRMSERGTQLMEESDQARKQTTAIVWERLTQEEQEQVLHLFKHLTTLAEQAREEIGIPMPPLPDRWKDESGEEQSGNSSQPVVDLMARPIRGKVAS